MTTKKDIERAEIVADAQTTARVVESMVLRGDISSLSPDERAKFYLQMCEGLGLAAASQPFAVLKLNGKEILYPTRGATDHLAAIHRLNREIVDGPKVIDVGGTKMIYAVCRATHPNGRVETAVATVPLTDPLNGLMKAETKAKRRATLSILGLGMLDEAELDTIPASAKSPAAPITVSVHGSATPPDAPAPPLDATVPKAILDLRSDLLSCEEPQQVAQAWITHAQAVELLEQAQRAAGWNDAVGRFDALGGSDGRKGLSKAIERERERLGATRRIQAKSKRPESAPYTVALDPVVHSAPEWRSHLEAKSGPRAAFAVSTGFHKRAAEFRAAGVLPARRAATVDRLCALLPADEAQASAWLDAQDPSKRSARRDSESARRLDA